MIKKVLITGSTNGIGFECAKYFMHNGFSVIAHYHSENENLNTIKKIEMNECIHCDFSNDNAFNNFLHKVKSMQIEILVNNAGWVFLRPTVIILLIWELQMTMKSCVKGMRN